MGKKSKRDGVEKGSNINEYERLRMLRIKENQARLQEIGLKRIVDSVTSLADGQSVNKKKKKLLRTSDKSAEDAQNLDCGGGQGKEGSSTDVIVPKEVVPVASMLTPNQFEAEQLTNSRIISEEHGREACRILHAAGPSKKYATEARNTLDKNVMTIGEMLSHKKQLPPQTYTYQESSQSVFYDMPSSSTMDADDSSASSEDEDDELDEEEFLNLQSQPEAKKGAKKRGPTMMHHVHVREPSKRKVIICNEFGQPIGPVTNEENTVGEFSRFLGTIGREYNSVPLIYDSWHKVPHKHKLLEYVLEKYTVPDMAKKWVLKSIGAARRTHKSRVKKNHFYKHNDGKARWENEPKTIPDTDFFKLLALWNKKSERKRSAIERDRCNSQKNRHTIGPKSFARVHEEMKNENPNKEPPSLAEVFERTRQRKEGRQYAEPFHNTAKKIEAMNNYKPLEGSSDTDAYLFVLGKKSDGRCRLYGRGVTSKMLKKVKGTENSYVVTKEVFESITNTAEIEKSYQRGKAEMEQLLREMSANQEKQRMELEEMRRNFAAERESIIEDTVKQFLAKLPTKVVRKYLS